MRFQDKNWLGEAWGSGVREESWGWVGVKSETGGSGWEAGDAQDLGALSYRDRQSCAGRD